MRKYIGALLLLIATSSHADEAYKNISFWPWLHNVEKKVACNAIINRLNQGYGNKLSNCQSGNWIVLDIQEDDCIRKVEFKWKGKLSINQLETNRCKGYVYTKKCDNFENISTLDLQCEYNNSFQNE